MPLSKICENAFNKRTKECLHRDDKENQLLYVESDKTNKDQLKKLPLFFISSVTYFLNRDVFHYFNIQAMLTLLV